MDELKNTYKIIKNMYNEITGLDLTYEDFVAIYPKLKMINNIGVADNENAQMIYFLLDFKKNNLLDRLNLESINLASSIYLTQKMIPGALAGNTFSIILRHLLYPYKLNKCDEHSDVYSHMFSFELFFSLVCGIHKNLSLLFPVYKYNSELNEMVLRFNKLEGKYGDVLRRNPSLPGAIIHIFSIFYFNQDIYDNDYELLNQIVNNICEDEIAFMKYCEEEDIEILATTKEKIDGAFKGLINMIDIAYTKKREEKRK